MSLFGRLEFWDAFYIFGKFVEPKFRLQTIASNGILTANSWITKNVEGRGSGIFFKYYPATKGYFVLRHTFQPATYTVSAESLPSEPVWSVLLLHTTIKYRCYKY
jgi:hypothetical protein